MTDGAGSIVFDTSLDYVRGRLEPLASRPAAADAATRHAAVAVILQPGDAGTEVLLIRRAERDGDPWSGHMAFPGGHLDDDDDHLVAAALRETHEEVGLRMPEAALLGAIEPVRANPRGRPINMVVHPFVFAPPRAGALVLNHEVADTVWWPLEPLARGEGLTQLTWAPRGVPASYPGYQTSAGIVWGMTYRMLHHLFQALWDDWRPPELPASVREVD